MPITISNKGSPFTSHTSCSSMKSGVKRIAESIESARTRVSIMTCLYDIPNNVCTLNHSGRKPTAARGYYVTLSPADEVPAVAPQSVSMIRTGVDVGEA